MDSFSLGNGILNGHSCFLKNIAEHKTFFRLLEGKIDLLFHAHQKRKGLS
jgi:hypothetical protein